MTMSSSVFSRLSACRSSLVKLRYPPTNLTNNTTTEITRTIHGSKRTNHWLESQQPITSWLNWATIRRIYTINWRSTIHMTLKMTSAQVVETSVIVNNNSSFQNYTNPDDHTQQYGVRGVSLENLTLLILLLFSHYIKIRFWFQFFTLISKLFRFHLFCMIFHFLGDFFDFQNFIVWFLEWFFDFQNFIVWFLEWFFDFHNFIVWFLKWNFYSKICRFDLFCVIFYFLSNFYFYFEIFFFWFLEWFFDFQNLSLWFLNWNFDFQNLSLRFIVSFLISWVIFFDFQNFIVWYLQ